MHRAGRTCFLAAVLAAACSRPDLLPETPRIEASAARLTFTAPGGGYDPAAAPVTVTSVGGPLEVTGVSAVYAGRSGWLSFEVRDPTSSPAALTVRPHVAGLPSGTYEATVFVSASGAVNSPLPVPVSLVVPPPRMVASASDVSFLVSDGEPPPPYQIRVANAGGGPLAKPTVTVQYEGGSGWLSAEVTGTAEPWSVVLRPDLTGVHAVGYHAARVTIRSDGAVASRSVFVSMWVNGPRVEPSTGFVLFGFQAGAAAPAAKTIPLWPVAVPGVSVGPPTASVGSTWSVNHQDCAGWLEATVSGSAPPYELTLAPVPAVLARLAPGGCTSYVELRPEPPATPSSVRVELWVQSVLQAPLLQASEEFLAFSALAGGDDPSPRTVTVFDALGAAFATPDLSIWDPWLGGTLSGTAAPYTLSIEPHVAGLAAGTYDSAVSACVVWGNCYPVQVRLELADWAVAGNLRSWSPSGHTTTALADGRALVVGEGSVAGDWGRFEVYDPARAPLEQVRSSRGQGNLGTPRLRHTATALPDGRVVVAGGAHPGSGIAVETWEVFAPASETWHVARPLRTARFGHTATLLGDGRVLLAGGATGTEQASVVLASAEILGPGDGSTEAPPMASPRVGASAVRLADGRVLVAGGRAADGTALATAELFDPAQGTWSTTGRMAEARAEAALVLLADGDVLVAGGAGAAGVLATAELYDPLSGTWRATGRMTTGRVAPAVRLPNGRVLLVAGSTGDRAVTGTVERYDPWTGAWSAAGALKIARRGHSATLLSTGRVLVTGGGVPLSDPAMEEFPWGTELGTGVTP